ncbi:hypothetical protein [Lactiplantibacillus carotarum]|uniref:hypothetical protein n=1 Tax=Lactiplantibacillus carotarum TaxID=2993456 RepID=UPI00298EDB01|nr:hypothetical protein [Lactiplantibacillus carotarum]
MAKMDQEEPRPVNDDAQTQADREATATLRALVAQLPLKDLRSKAQVQAWFADTEQDY